MIWSNATARTTVKKYGWFAARSAAAFIVDGVAVADIYKANFVWLNRWVERAEWRHFLAREIDEDMAGKFALFRPSCNFDPRSCPDLVSTPGGHVDLLDSCLLWEQSLRATARTMNAMSMPYAARTLTRNSSTALRSMPDWVSSSRAFASTSDAALPVAAAAVVTPPIWLEISFDPAATD